MMFTIQEILDVTQGKLIQAGAVRKVRSVCIDSRKVKRGSLFVAIKGERFDGHDFVAQAVKQGAVAVVVSRGLSPKGDCPLIKVKDTVKALGQIAKAHRDRFDVPIIAITGSAGKTTTKEMIASVLQSQYKVLKNEGSYNNQIGVPLTLLKIKPFHQIVVVEIGTNQPGDIAELTSIVQPSIAIMTNIGESHLERLKSPEKVFQEKISLVKGLPKGATVIFNKDDAFLKKIPARFRQKTCLSFGMNKGADYQATDIVAGQKGRINFKVNARHAMQLPTPAFSNMYNALASISCGRLFNISYNIIYTHLKRFGGIKGRQKVACVKGFVVIDDTYNANPVSFRGALQLLDAFPATGRKILVCADMLELGQKAQVLHQEIGEVVAESSTDVVLTYGSLSFYTAQKIKKVNSRIEVCHFKTRSSLNKKLLKRCQPGDVVLIKGSHGMHMEKTVECLGNG